MNPRTKRKIDYDSPAPSDLNVMDALNLCIRKYGLKKTRMDDIAQHANVTRISLYRHYGNRNDLINCFLSYRSHQFHRRIRHQLNRCHSLEEALEAYILNAVLLAARDDSVRELVDVHHVLQDALKFQQSEIKDNILDFWRPLFKKFCSADSKFSKIDLQEFVDWLILVESSLILVVTGADWDRKRVKSMIKNYLVPSFSN